MGFARSSALVVLLAVAVLAGSAAAGAVVATYFAFLKDLPDLRRVEDFRPALASTVVDRDGNEIARFFEERRTLTPYDAIPRHVVQAFLASEDSTFFEHSGIDFVAIARAAWKNLLAGQKRQGGSTITQQVVKGLLLTPERTYRRKIREMILAQRIEQRFTKEEILYFYLNQIYFGHGAYGIGEAARTHFGKEVGDLDVAEAALLAGLPKAPSRYSPYSDPEAAEQRRRYVLDRMLEEGFLDAATHAAARANPPELAPAHESDDWGVAAYFVEEVRRRLYDELGADTVLRGGLRVETTLDPVAQEAAVRSLRNGLIDLDRRQGYRGPVRHVAREEIPAELARLEIENDVGGAGGDEPPGIDEQLSGEALLPGGSEASLLGVVTEVDSKGMWARVGFAPGVEGVVRLEDVAWARPPDRRRSPYRMLSTRKIFEVGDVAHFAPLALGEEEARTSDALRVTLEQEPAAQAALLSYEIESQEVQALVGGYDFRKSQFDRVTQARRQPGSAFKPIIYAAAISKGYTPASIVFDRPIVYTDSASGFTWRPRNYKRSFYGPITLREALARSINNATVHLFRDVGVDYVIEYARRLGIESPLSRDLSLALGSSGVSLLELTRAYGVFAAGGRRVVPKFIRRVLDRDGNVLLENVALGGAPPPLPEDERSELLDVVESAGEPPSDGAQVIPPEQAYLALDLLRAVVVDPKGTGGRLRALRRPVAGKTGTTNEQGDAWFVGFSPEIVTGVWVGHDEQQLLGWGETGSRAAAPIWVDYMRAELADLPVRDFPVPDPIVFARIDRESGLLADAGSDNTVIQAFAAGTVPKESAQRARSASEGRRLLRMDSF